MSDHAHDLLRDLLRRLRASGTLGQENWDLVIRQGRQSGLLARLATELELLGLLSAVPEDARAHLEGEQSLARHQVRDVHWEVNAIKAALAPAGIPFILLKGAAYVMADLPTARGRLFGDIDILVPRAQLDATEATLVQAGWHATEVDAYDERYYREWIHQIPPMTHFSRRSTIDVHHTIVAPTAGLALDAQKLIAAAIPLANDPAIKLLAPADMILHSAAHLLNEGEFDRGLRDLDDLNLLLRYFGRDEQFWPLLLDRAVELDLRRPLYYALRYASTLLGTPVPDRVRDSALLTPPPAPARAVIDPMFERALRPHHPSCRDALSGISLGILYIRGHLLLMPLPMLIPHLVHKALKRRRESRSQTEVPAKLR